MMEYQTIVNVGKNSVKVTFSGGSISNGCTQPARFSSKNLIIQNAIEGSEEFKRGRIRLEKAISLNEEIKVEKPDSKMHNAQSTMHNQAESGGTLAEDIPSPGDKPMDTSPIETTEAISESEGEAPGPEQKAESSVTIHESSEEGLMEVEVSCKDVAKQYLQNHYDERPAPLRTWVDVQACAAKHGIIFKSPTLE